MMKEKKDINHILLKFGMALSLSLAGFAYTRLRNRRIKPSSTMPSGIPSGNISEINLSRAQYKDDLHAIKGASSSCNTVSEGHILDTQEETCVKKVNGDSSSIGLSPCSKQSGEKDEFLLPEFNDLFNEKDFRGTIVGNSHQKEGETPRSKAESPKAYVSAEKDDYEQEIRHLRNMIRMLQDRERSLEVQMLEYCGLREKETAVMELQNRLKISNMEAKMFNLKVETLQSENRRLEAQVADHAKVIAELEGARAKVKMLKKKLKYEAEQSREQIITLQQKVAELRDQEHKAAASDGDVQMKLQKLSDLESEAEELRKSNLRFQIDNSDLARRLDSTQILANAVLEDQETGDLKEETERLRQENVDLEKKIEQLQADRCSDVEELVYLRWINACLRYELRHCQAPPGKTVARDLSKSLSPTSEKKAKQLILDYANSEGIGERGVSLVDFDYDQWSSSHTSFLTDSGDCDDYSSVGNSSTPRNDTKNKNKFFNKLRKLIRGKDSHNRSQGSPGEKSGSQDSNSPHFRSSVSTGNDNGAEGRRSDCATPTQISRTSFDFYRLTSLKKEDRTSSDSFVLGSSKKFSLSKGRSGDYGNFISPFPDNLGIEKSELVKYAEALKDSGESSKQTLSSRSASYSSF